MLRANATGPATSALGKMSVAGPVSLGDATLAIDVSFPFGALVGAVLPIIDKTSGGPVTGTFAGLPEGHEVVSTSGAYTFRISYVGGDGNDVTLTVLKTTREYLLSEGATSALFSTDIAIANPSSTNGIPIRVDFLPPNGAPLSTFHSLNALSRKTITVNDIPELAGAEFSTQVHSLTGDPLIVERTMRWDATGYGAHTEHAVETLGTTWYFAEGSQGFFHTYLLLANPQAADNEATVQYLRTDEPPVTRTYPLTARSRRTIDLAADAALMNRSFGMTVTFAQPGMAERAMYFGATPFFAGGHGSAGVTAPSTTWFVPEVRPARSSRRSSCWRIPAMRRSTPH